MRYNQLMPATKLNKPSGRHILIRGHKVQSRTRAVSRQVSVLAWCNDVGWSRKQNYSLTWKKAKF